MKKMLMFEFSFTNGLYPTRRLVFGKEVSEIIPVGTHYHPFGNALRAGVLAGPYTIDDKKNEIIMIAVSQLPFEKYNREEGVYIRENMKKCGWSIAIDTIDNLE